MCWNKNGLRGFEPPSGPFEEKHELASLVVICLKKARGLTPLVGVTAQRPPLWPPEAHLQPLVWPRHHLVSLQGCQGQVGTTQITQGRKPHLHPPYPLPPLPCQIVGHLAPLSKNHCRMVGAAITKQRYVYINKYAIKESHCEK